MVVRRSARAFAGVCPSGAGSECSWGRGFSPGSRGRAFSFFSGALRVSAGWSLCVAWLGSVDASTGRAAVGFPGWVLGRRLVSAIMKSAPRTIFELSVPVVAVLGRVGAALNGYGRELPEGRDTSLGPNREGSGAEGGVAPSTRGRSWSRKSRPTSPQALRAITSDPWRSRFHSPRIRARTKKVISSRHMFRSNAMRAPHRA